MNKNKRISVVAVAGIIVGLAAGSAAALWSTDQTTARIESGYASAQTWIAVGNGLTESERVYFQGTTYPLESSISAASRIRTADLAATLPGMTDFLSGDATHVSIPFTLWQANTGKFTQSAHLKLLYPAAFADFTGSIESGACPETPAIPTTPLSELGAATFDTVSLASVLTTGIQAQTTSYCLILGRSSAQDIAYENTVSLSGLESQPLEVTEDSESTWAGTITGEASILPNLNGLALEASLFWEGT